MSLLLPILLGILAVLASLGSWLVWSRRPKEVPFQCFRCPACDQKLRYLAHRAGRTGICPRCKQRCTFPVTSRVSGGDGKSGEAVGVRVGQVRSRVSQTRAG